MLHVQRHDRRRLEVYKSVLLGNRCACVHKLTYTCYLNLRYRVDVRLTFPPIALFLSHASHSSLQAYTPGPCRLRRGRAACGREATCARPCCDPCREQSGLGSAGGPAPQPLRAILQQVPPPLALGEVALRTRAPTSNCAMPVTAALESHCPQTILRQVLLALPGSAEVVCGVSQSFFLLTLLLRYSVAVPEIWVTGDPSQALKSTGAELYATSG